MPIKKRVCDLIRGDIFELTGRCYIVTMITDEHVIFASYASDSGSRQTFGKKSQQIVEFINNKSFAGDNR